MSAAVPTTVPRELGAGRSAQWKISCADYTAGAGYTLRYVLHDGTNKISITSAADGNDHLVTVSTTDSASWVAGTYAFQAYAEKTNESWLVDEGTIAVLPDFAGAATHDPRTATKRQLDAINTAIESLAHGTLQSYTTVSGTYTKKNLRELMDIRDRLLISYRVEQGSNKPRHIKTRFSFASP